MAVNEAKIGTPPPAHAPKESTRDERPMTTAEIEAQMRAARANEKPLPTFAPVAEKQVRLPPGIKPSDPDAVAQFQAWTKAGSPANWDAEAFRAAAVAVAAVVPRGTGADASSGANLAEKSRNFAENRPDPAVDLVELYGDSASRAVTEAFADVVAAKLPPPEPARPLPPAASDSESPSRGVPKGNLPPDKQITGGFGVSAGAASLEYVPLDGSEVCKLLQGLLLLTAEQIQNDLRLSLAVTYPRVRARVELIVESYTGDADFKIVRHLPEQNRAPVDVARQHADEVCFVIVAQRQEFGADGKPESPANALRAEMGLEIPHKQLIDTPTGRVIVDRRS